MTNYTFKPASKAAKAACALSRVSSIHSALLCKNITGMNAAKAKKLLQDLVEHKRSLNGRYYDRTAKEILYYLSQAEHNAEFQGLDTSRLIVHASANQGFRYARPRRFCFHRRLIKSANLQVVLHQQ